ncbi:MAG: hypothetical protein FWG63_07955 [Defluviitaleaceae bacterium]|nr:hypothetical protein [Defluviitaleaceae bacterium]
MSANNTGNPKRGKKIVIILVTLVLILVAGVAFMVWPGNISRAQAQEIAVAHVGGGVAGWPDWDFEHFQRVWYVEVFYQNLVHSVYVNRSTGQVVRVEIDFWD